LIPLDFDFVLASCFRSIIDNKPKRKGQKCAEIQLRCSGHYLLLTRIEKLRKKHINPTDWRHLLIGGMVLCQLLKQTK